MKKILNYITNGQGMGLKYFTLFSVFICILCWFLFSSVLMKKGLNNEDINKFFDKIPTLQIADGRLIEPKNTYLSIPVVEGYNDELIINTVPEVPVNLNFASGVYLSQEAIYLKLPAVTNDIQVMKWSDVGNRIIDRAALEQGLKSVINLFATLLTIMFAGILWLGYLLVQITTKLFFWVLGYSSVQGQTKRAVTLAWIGVLSVNFILLVFSLQLSIPVVFVMAVILAVSLVFIADKNNQMPSQKAQGHAFFDSVSADEENGVHTTDNHIKPIKVASQKKNLKRVEKPRREATKKTKK